MNKKKRKVKICWIYLDPIVHLISVPLSHAAHRILMKNVPFFFKTIVFDRIFLEITDVNVLFYNNI